MNPETKKKPPLWTLILAVLIISAIVAVMLLAPWKNAAEKHLEKETEKTTEHMDREDPSVQGQETQPTMEPVSPTETAPTEQMPSEETTEPSSNTTATSPQETTPVIGDGEIYEERLAAAMVVGISMMYPDFQFHGIYIASETPLEAHSGSRGAYVLFSSGGQSLALRSLPLDAERQEKGTADLYVPTLGYSTYELVDPQTVATSAMKELQLTDLEEAINQSTQTTVIER